MVNAALKNTASMTMSTNNHAVATNSLVDELSIFGRKAVKTFLDDVITIEILHKLNNIALQSANDGLSLLRSRDKLNHLLQCTGSMLVKSNFHQLRRGKVNQGSTLFIIGEF
jgi:hypothetical protein